MTRHEELAAKARACSIDGGPEEWWLRGNVVYGGDGDGVATCYPSMIGPSAEERAAFIEAFDPSTADELLRIASAALAYFSTADNADAMAEWCDLGAALSDAGYLDRAFPSPPEETEQ